jgi:hypothetical protein
MSTEFLFTTRGVKGIGAKVEIDMERMRPEDFSALYAAFIHMAGCKSSPDFVTMFTLYPDQCDRGIYWHEALCPDGMRLTIVVPPEVDAASLKLAQNRLRDRFDVVSIKTLRVKQWVTIPEKLSTFQYANH